MRSSGGECGHLWWNLHCNPHATQRLLMWQLPNLAGVPSWTNISQPWRRRPIGSTPSRAERRPTTTTRGWTRVARTTIRSTSKATREAPSETTLRAGKLCGASQWWRCGRGGDRAQMSITPRPCSPTFVGFVARTPRPRNEMKRPTQLTRLTSNFFYIRQTRTANANSSNILHSPR